MTKLTGSDKQIAWAEDIRAEMLNEVSMDGAQHIIRALQKGTPKASEVMETIKGKLTQDVDANNEMILNEVRELVKAETSAKTFIENQSLIGFLHHQLS